MGKTHYVIYIPGVGDHNPRGQTRLLKRWEKQGVSPVFIKFGWAEAEPLQKKIKPITELIDKLHGGGHAVSVVGVSAGAGAAINVYAKRPSKISGVVFICGKIVGDARTVGQHYLSRNPVLAESLLKTQENLQKLNLADKSKMLCLSAIVDEIVYKKYSRIPGVKSKSIPSLFHIPSIFLEITLFKRQTTNFLKQQAVKYQNE